jgi:hypothetical protein
MNERQHSLITGAIIFVATILSFAIIISIVPTGVCYENHGVGQYTPGFGSMLDVVLFEITNWHGYWSTIEWAHLPVKNVIIHYQGNQTTLRGISGFHDSYNPYIIEEICDENYKFAYEGDLYVIFACPIEDRTYHAENKTLELWIGSRFTIKTWEESTKTTHFIY